MSFHFRDYAEATAATGGMITEPGAYLNVPMARYHGQPCPGFSVSSSGLRTIFLQSLKHFWHESSLNPDREEKEQTEPMILGRAAHHLLLGEADFGKHFVVRPAELNGEAWNSNKKICKQWLVERALDGLTVLKGEQVEQVKGMAESLAKEGPIQGGILNGHVEVSMFWQDAETGIWLKWRPDVIPNHSGDFADLKCVADVSDDGISRALGERGYHQQGALGGEACRHVPGVEMEMEHFTLVYVEQKKPHCVRFEDVSPDDLAEGGRENRAALRLLKRALDTNYWPGPQSLGGEGGFVRRMPFAAKRAAERLRFIELELSQ